MIPSLFLMFSNFSVICLDVVWIFHKLFESRNLYLSVPENFLCYVFNNFLPSVFSSVFEEILLDIEPPCLILKFS